MKRMPKSLLIAAALAVGLSLPAQAQVPERIGLSARLVDAAGAPVAGLHDMALALYDVEAGGAALWNEALPGVPFTAEGLVSLELGGISPLTPVVLDGRRLFLSISVDGTAMSPRVPILSVPYAVRATSATEAARLGSLGPDDVQRRVGGACMAGGAIRAINDDGSVVCQGTGGAYTAGTGIDITGSAISVDTTAVQARVAAACPSGQSMRAIGQTGSVTCEVDNDTTYSAPPGSGVNLNGTQLSVDTTVQRRLATGSLSCPLGQYMRNVSPNGNTVCAPALSCTRVLGAATAATDTIACPTGNIVMGGGCSVTGSTNAVLDSYPISSSSWFCRTVTGGTVTAYALCCDVTF